jgi:hypothetical protein
VLVVRACGGEDLGILEEPRYEIDGEKDGHKV